jgi:hypothetical protein
MEDAPLLDIAIDQECAFIKINAILVGNTIKPLKNYEIGLTNEIQSLINLVLENLVNKCNLVRQFNPNNSTQIHVSSKKFKPFMVYQLHALVPL